MKPAGTRTDTVTMGAGRAPDPPRRRAEHAMTTHRPRPGTGARRAPRARRGAGAALAALVLLHLAPGALAPARADASAAARYGLPDFTELVERNHAAVVNISTRKASRRSGEEGPLAGIPGLEDSPIDELIRRYREGERPADPSISSALGSGFIVSGDGYVLTNNHVVADADEVLVRLHDRRQFVAEVVGTDPSSDMAVLKIDGQGLPTVTIGDSEALSVGEWVLAIGSPFGFDFSVTSGIVSAIGRALPNESYVPFIQTDVAINPGNSGGPLFDLDGEVVGVNSQIYSRTGSFMGLSFAIPIEMAMDVADQIREHGEVRRGWLGVIIQEVTADLAESFDMRTAHGALVTNILEGSPAEASELEIGDVITHFDGRRIERSSSLPPLVGRVEIDTAAPLEVVRDGRTVELEVVIGRLPQEPGGPGGAERRGPRDAEALGLAAGPVDEATRERLDIDQGGVRVTSVAEGGPAERAGIVPGDVVLMVDNVPVDSARELAKVVAELGERASVPVLVQRESGPSFLALKLGER